jgi:K+-sensing histidine kinase KdpD
MRIQHAKSSIQTDFLQNSYPIHIHSELKRYSNKHAMINRMENHTENIVLIESDPEISRLIADQALRPLGYHVDVFTSGSQAVQEAGKLSPAVIVTSLNLDGLSGKDLMIALSSLGNTAPIVVIANKGQDSEILQAIRLGAADFLVYPIREAEVINVIENTLARQRVINQVDVLSKELEKNESAIKQQLSDFSSIFSFAKLAVSALELRQIINQLVSLAIPLTQADCGWYLSFDSTRAEFILEACSDVPEPIKSKLNLPYEDEFSSLAAASGQVVHLHGEALQSFKTLETFGAALVVPLISNQAVAGTITVARNSVQPFTNRQQSMLEIIAELTVLALENSYRFLWTEQRVNMLQQANIYANLEANLKNDLLRQASSEIRSPLKILMENVDYLLDRCASNDNPELSAAINNIQEEAEILMDISDSMINTRQIDAPRLDQIDLTEIVRNTINRFRPIAQMGKITISLDAPLTPTFIRAYPSQVTKVIEGLLSNALKYSPSNGEVLIQIIKNDADFILSIADQGNGIDEQWAERLFEIKSSIFGYTAKRFGGIGISLPIIKEIITAYKGTIWIEPLQGKGYKIAFSFPSG